VTELDATLLHAKGMAEGFLFLQKKGTVHGE